MAIGNDSKSGKRFELWKSPTDGEIFFAEDNDSARRLLAADATLITVIVASSWEEAQTKRHEFLGLEPYKPMK